MAKKKKAKAKKSKSQKKMEDATGVFIPAGLLIGMGVGFAVGNLVAWLFIGLGAGFLAMAIANMVMWKKKL